MGVQVSRIRLGQDLKLIVTSDSKCQTIFDIQEKEKKERDFIDCEKDRDNGERQRSIIQ